MSPLYDGSDTPSLSSMSADLQHQYDTMMFTQLKALDFKLPEAKMSKTDRYYTANGCLCTIVVAFVLFHLYCRARTQTWDCCF